MTDTETGQSADVHLKKLHPFFSAPTAPSKSDDAVTPPTPDPSCSPTSDKSGNEPAEPIEYPNDHCELFERKRKRIKSDPSPSTTDTLAKALRTKRRTRVPAASSIISLFGQDAAKDKQIDINFNQAQDNEQIREQHNRNTKLPSALESKPVLETISDATKDKENQGVAQSTRGQKSQKLLKLNPATGTIGSPPRSAPLSTSTSSKTGAKRGRKPKTFLIIISYGLDTTSRERVGQQIDAVLLGTSRITSPMPTIAAPKTPPSGQGSTNDNVLTTMIPKKRTPNKKAASKKPSHPFFQTKDQTASATNTDGQKAKKEKAPPKRDVIFTSTPCSPRHARLTPSNFSIPALGSKNGGLKIPGAQYPAWPWRGMVHIRDSSSTGLSNSSGLKTTMVSSRGRKAKGQQIQLRNNESILYGIASRLDVHQLAIDLKSSNDEDFRPIAPVVRVPIKHFESGRKLQARVFSELRTLKGCGSSFKAHPAIIHAYNSIPTTLSAFDRSTCESVAWAQKYAPTTAHCVLQNGREAELLRDWLQTLKVQAVDTGAADNVPKPKSTLTLKKKRRHKKLEGFVVSSDEEANEMDEISENESQWLVHGGRGDSKKTVVRSGDAVDRGGKPSSRLTNSVLLSGPHGCGKTATVYAIAKELGFEVFEINPGARRSGRDILEKIGDMTRNHQVNRQQKDDTQGDAVTDDEVAKDLKSGKQGMMTSFFQPKSSQPKKEVKKDVQTLEAQVPTPQEKKPNRDQKQSLILLEEVDILYEEDKQFWATVISTIAQSKRPFIMTCNNESVIPLQNLKLHGIFRLSSPPPDLAVDMLLLIAANEGHPLGRHAVEALYESRGHDLRAAITELNYWCQIGVGDLRGGFDWFYPRWPKGSDIDGEGQTIRVVSQDTYHTGMGWFNRDLIASESSSPSIVPNLHQEAWTHWGLDISDHHEFKGSSDWAEKVSEQACSRAARLALLQSVEAFADSISDSDICGPFLPPLSNHITLDTTTPDLHSKTLDDFTVGNKLLQATPLCHYNSISLGVSTSLRILAQSKLLNSQPFPESAYSIGRFDEKCVTSDIEHHLKMSSESEGPLTRKDYSIAFDPIAASEKLLGHGYLDPSVFDGIMTPICLDVAPYVRSIVSYDQRLQNERRMRSSLLSEGGKPEKKRMRTTRAALSALEGGSRATTRGEKYFAPDINPYLVMRTGGKGWEDLAHQADGSNDYASTALENHDADMFATSDES
ncbi:hypothetical protein HD806DRAFT_232366 [Xylariaceae sp. AK1471]|nr:hypothetical protein HD806DRAFT_232366 [Xylariaceae sp. AK1471]